LPVPFQKDPEVSKVQEADPIKKKKKRTLEMFLKKENIYPFWNSPILSILFQENLRVLKV